jgi:hypothetical protein
LAQLSGAQLDIAKDAIKPPWTSFTILFEVNVASPPRQQQQRVYGVVNDFPATAFEPASLQPLNG